MMSETSPARILLTGASAGIGRAAALEYARRRARLVLVARRSELLEERAGEVRSLGGEAVTLAADVTAPDTPQRALQLAERSFGGLDIVIMNAAIGEPNWGVRSMQQRLNAPCR